MDIGFGDDGLLSIVRVQNLPQVLGRSAADSQRKIYTGQVRRWVDSVNKQPKVMSNEEGFDLAQCQSRWSESDKF
ncbi:hypothetical protein D8674_005817 [Pyrus ussuriensis x Pyrus communis]|uniref:Uncharacterized protein n=1 Tax=Pyrus ussuriensis x Pyrus communis TaxID=2448454 RepID=A0A5N5FXJ3_9ROSA|nr:hypothetical protein D8674_005817 [Pyrus ussuriensis x Pyrus communis]